MEPFANGRRDARSYLRPERPWAASEVGVILLNESFKLVAYNREAATILAYPDAPSTMQRCQLELPRQLINDLPKPASASRGPSATYFRAGKRQYVCRSYFLEAGPEEGRIPMIALLLQRNSSLDFIIHRIAGKFGLTERESEALVGISMGLTSKEMAERMNISPNTVKTYLRLIMMKMGVSNRGKIFAKMLEDDSLWDTDRQEEELMAAAEH